MVKKICPYCKKLKAGVGPKIVGRNNLDMRGKIMCNDCYKLYQRGKLDLI